MARQKDPNRWMRHLATPVYIKNISDETTTRTGLQLVHQSSVRGPSKYTYLSTMLVFTVPRACGVICATLYESKHHTMGNVTSYWEINLHAKLQPNLLARRMYCRGFESDEPYEDYDPRLFSFEYWSDLPNYMAYGRSGSGMKFNLNAHEGTELRASLTEWPRTGHKYPTNVTYAIMALLGKVQCYIAPVGHFANLGIEFWPPTHGREDDKAKQQELWQNCTEQGWQMLTRLAPDEVAKFRAKLQ